MTKDQFEAALRALCRRQPFRSFLIEFVSGNQLSIGHPEAVRAEGELYLTRRPDGGGIAILGQNKAHRFLLWWAA